MPSAEGQRAIELVRSTLPLISDGNPENHSQVTEHQLAWLLYCGRQVNEDELALLVMFAMECSDDGAKVVIAELKPHIVNADVRPAAGCTALSVLEECTKHGGIEFRSQFKTDKWAARIEKIVTTTVKQEVRQHFCNTLNSWCDMIESTNGWGNEAGVESQPMSNAAARINSIGIGISWRDRMNQRHGFAPPPRRGSSEDDRGRLGNDEYEVAAARVDDAAFGIGDDEAMAWSLHNQQAELPNIVNAQEEKDAAFAQALQSQLDAQQPSPAPSPAGPSAESDLSFLAQPPAPPQIVTVSGQAVGQAPSPSRPANTEDEDYKAQVAKTIEASLQEMGGAQATPEDQEKLAEAIRVSLEEEDLRMSRHREESIREEQEMELAMFRSVVRVLADTGACVNCCWQNSGIPMEWQGELQHLRELGFSYEDSVECMQATGGDMAKTVDMLMARGPSLGPGLGPGDGGGLGPGLGPGDGGGLGPGLGPGDGGGLGPGRGLGPGDGGGLGPGLGPGDGGGLGPGFGPGGGQGGGLLTAQDKAAARAKVAEEERKKEETKRKPMMDMVTELKQKLGAKAGPAPSPQSKFSSRNKVERSSELSNLVAPVQAGKGGSDLNFDTPAPTSRGKGKGKKGGPAVRGKGGVNLQMGNQSGISRDASILAMMRNLQGKKTGGGGGGGARGEGGKSSGGGSELKMADELKGKSKFFVQVHSDFETYGPGLTAFAAELRDFAGQNPDEIARMWNRVESILEPLSDREGEVLKLVENWPHGKIECMQMAIKRHSGLTELLGKIRGWPHAEMEAPAELTQLGRAMDAIVGRIDPLNRNRESDQAKFTNANLHFDNTLVGKISQSTVILARRACTLALSLVDRWGAENVGVQPMPHVETKELFTQVNESIQHENERKEAAGELE